MLKLTNYFGVHTTSDKSLTRGFKYIKEKVAVQENIDLGVGKLITNENFLEQLDSKAKDLYLFTKDKHEYVFSLKEMEEKLNVAKKN